MKYFKPSEYRCRCSRATCPAPRELHPELAARLVALREAVGRPLVLTSGLRCPEQNAKAGGVADSEHLTGLAVDVRADASQPRYAVLKHGLTLFNRIGVAKTFLHFGVSTTHPQRVVWLYS